MKVQTVSYKITILMWKLISANNIIFYLPGHCWGGHPGCQSKSYKLKKYHLSSSTDCQDTVLYNFPFLRCSVPRKYNVVYTQINLLFYKCSFNRKD